MPFLIFIFSNFTDRTNNHWLLANETLLLWFPASMLIRMFLDPEKPNSWRWKNIWRALNEPDPPSGAQLETCRRRQNTVGNGT